MNHTIVVNATAARTGGALSILVAFVKTMSDERFFLRYKIIVFTSRNLDHSISSKIEVINVGQKNYLQRIKWDYFGLTNFLEDNSIEPALIVSMQNTGVVYSKKCPQIIYYHNPFCLTPYKWNPFTKSERTLWFYTHIYPIFVKSLLKKNTYIIVQANWIKEAFSKKFTLAKNKIFVIKPSVNTLKKSPENINREKFTHIFFYPATAFKYKNHLLIFRILEEIKLYNPKFLDKIRIRITLNLKDLAELNLLDKYSEFENNVELLGYLNEEEMRNYYFTSGSLLFPSKIETLGLPLLEAASIGMPIIAASLSYAYETLSEYKNVIFLDPDNPRGWMLEILNQLNNNNSNSSEPKKIEFKNTWLDMIEVMDNVILKYVQK